MPIDSPYNFVPLAQEVYLPEGAEALSQDVPFREGISGTLEIRVTAKTPIYVRSGGEHSRDPKERNTPAYRDFFRVTPQGPYALPGTSVKGMIRGVLEIASFGKIAGTSGDPARVSDHRYAVRDLQNPPLYTNYIAETVGGAFRPKVRAGWLRQVPEGEEMQWEVTLCDFARVEQEDLEKFFYQETHQMISLGKRQNAKDKYHSVAPLTTVSFTCGPEKAHEHSDGKRLIYRKATDLGRGDTSGTLVLTGQPAPRDGKPGKKHLEFLFFNEENEENEEPVSLRVPAGVRKDFVFAHSELGEKRKPNTEWEFWEPFLKNNERVPVFLLMDKGTITSMGLAMMYRLPYLHSIHETIEHTSPRHRDGGVLDLGEQIFGRVEDQDALRGRVAVETLVAEGDPQPMPVVRTVLGAPKPTFYPNYVKQQTNARGELAGAYKTYMDGNAEIRGWKRYLSPRDGDAPTPSNPPSEKVATAFRPLPAGTTFSGRMVVHNLRPRELGALIWALTWGGNSNLRHSLGMGKPYGYGSVTVKIGTPHLAWLDPTRTDPPTPEACLRAFEDAMETWWKTAQLEGTWKESPQIKALRALANPGTPWPQNRAYPVLDSQARRNDFVSAKRDKLVLASMDRLAPARPATPPPPKAPAAPVALSPVETFLRGIEKKGNAKELTKIAKDQNLAPETVSPEDRKRIFQALKKHPSASNWDFQEKVLNLWKV